jgi:hypothetical protein
VHQCGLKLKSSPSSLCVFVCTLCKNDLNH